MSFGYYDFNAVRNSKAIIVMDYIAIVIFTLDVFAQLNSSFYRKYILISNYKDIFIRYFKKRSFFDIIIITGIIL